MRSSARPLAYPVMNFPTRIIRGAALRATSLSNRARAAVFAMGLLVSAPGLVQAQFYDPYVYDFVPSDGTTVGTASVPIKWSACSSQPQSGTGWSFQTQVNGVNVTTQPFGTATGYCQYAYKSGYSSPSGTLRVGANTISGKICTSSGCGTTSITINYVPGTPGISITPDGGTATSILVGSSASYVFTVTNTGGVAATPAVNFPCPAILQNCSVTLAGGVLNPGDWRAATVSYQGASAGTTQIAVSGNYLEYPSTTDPGTVTLTVSSPPPSYSVSVSVDDNDPINLSAGATSMTQRYTISNTSQNTTTPITFSLVMGGTLPGLSCPALNPMTLSPGGGNSIFVTCNIAPSLVATTGTVRLDASGSGVSNFVQRTVNTTPLAPTYAVTVAPLVPSATAPAGATAGSQTFTVTNNSLNTSESSISLSRYCSGALTCSFSMSSVTINPGNSLQVPVPYGIQLTGVDGTLQLSAGVGTNGTGTNSMTVHTTAFLGAVVIRENASQTLAVGATSGSTRFTVKNNSSNTMAPGATRTFDLPTACGSPSIPTCTSAPVSVALHDQDSTATWGVTANYTVTNSGTGGTVQLSASSAGMTTVSATTTVNTTPAAPALSITPDGGVATPLYVGASGSFAFGVKNTGNVRATPVVSSDCSVALQSCSVSSASGAMNPGDSVTLTASYQGASAGAGRFALTGHFVEYPTVIDSGIANVMVSDAPAYSVSVTVTGSEPTNVVAGTTSITQTYTVTNTSQFTSTGSQFTLVMAKTGAVTSCPALNPVTLLPGASYTTSVVCTIATSGPTTGTLRLTASASAPAAISGFVQRTVNLPASWGPAIDVSMNNPDLPSPSLCELSCFAASTTFNTVPYFSLDQSRNVTLVYNGDQAVPRPFIYADVHGASSVAVTKYTMQATLNGTAVTFLNGQTLLTFTGSQPNAPVRLGGQFDARSYTTNVYPLVVTVQATYANGVTGAPTTSSSYFTIINEGNSEIAKGWTVAGRQRLYITTSPGFLITNGDGSGTRFSALGVVAADFTTLTYDAGTTTYTRTYADGLRTTFNATLQHTASVAPNGLRINYAYYADGRLQYIGDPFRKQPGGALTSITLTYDANGLHSIQEPGADGTLAAGRATSFVVNASRCLVTSTAPDGIASSFTCDTNGRLATLTDRQGALTTIVYGASWKLSQIKLPTVPVDAGNGSTTNKTPIINYSPWQTLGVPTSTTSNSKPWTAPPVSSITGSITDPIARVTAFKPNQFGQAIDVTDPLGRHTYVDSSFSFLPRRIRHPNGTVDSLEYDAKGHLVTSRLVGQAPVDYHYNGKGLLDIISGPGVGTDTLYYNSNSQLTRVVQGGDPRRAVSYTYDASTSRVASITDPAGHVSSYLYDPTYGNQTQVTVPGGRSTTRSFDSYGRPQTTQSAGLPTRTTGYDVLNRPTSVLDGVNPKATRVGYNAMFAISITDPKDQVYKTDRNALGWAIRSYDPNTSFGSKLLRYDAAGRLTGLTNRRLQKLTFSYDAMDRLLVKAGTNTTSDTLSYSAGDSVIAGRNAVEKDSVFVDPATQADSVVILLGGRRFRIAHTSHPELSVPDTLSIANNAGTILSDRMFQADPETGALSSVNIGGQLASFGYDVDGARTSFSLGDFGQTQSRTSLESILEQTYGLDPTFHRAYHYDIVGRIDAEQRQFETNGSFSPGSIQRAFFYDQLGQLQRVESRQQPGCDQWPSSTYYNPDSLSADNGWRYTCVAQPTTTESFSYDEVGNRTDNGGSTIVGNRYQTFKGVTYTYDLDGNVTRKTKAGSFDRTYTWSAENRLLSASDGTTTVRYEYNALGQLDRKWIGPTGSEHVNRYFIWDGQHLIATLDSVFQRVEEYEHGSGIDDPIAFVTPQGGLPTFVRSPIKDGLGNIVGFGDPNIYFDRQLTSYDAWGMPSVSGTQRMSLQWKGLTWQGDVAQLSYAQNRWYDPDAGRFMSEDPAGLAGGLNLYAYAGNDPVNGSDPLGLAATPITYWFPFGGNNGSCDPGYEANFEYCAWVRAHSVWDTTSTVQGQGGGGGTIGPSTPIQHDPKWKTPGCFVAGGLLAVAGLQDAVFIAGVGLAMEAGAPVWVALASVAAVDALELDGLQAIKSSTRAIAIGVGIQARNVGFTTIGAGFTGEKLTFGGFLADMVPGLRTKRAFGAFHENCSGRS
jgi:RHS repeat-associated protein